MQLRPAAGQVDGSTVRCGTSRRSARTSRSCAIPVLVLSGRFDPTTPRSYALDTVASLDLALLLQFESSSHGVLDAGCPMDVVAAFIDDPADSLDDLCVAKMPPIAFTP